MNATETKLEKLTQYRGTENDVTFVIKTWESSYIGTHWTYYIWIPEAKCEDFERLWLPDKEHRFTPESPLRVSHDYYSVGWPEMHGGITYYAKHGHTVGARLVEIGCDFQHLFDSERGYPYRLEDVEAEARATAREAKEMFFKKVETGASK